MEASEVDEKKINPSHPTSAPEPMNSSITSLRPQQQPSNRKNVKLSICHLVAYCFCFLFTFSGNEQTSCALENTGLVFCKLCSSFGPIYKMFKDFSHACFQSGVA